MSKKLIWMTLVIQTLVFSRIGLAQVVEEAEFVKPAETAAKAPEPKPEEKEAIRHEAQASMAGLFAAGNTSSLAARAGGHYQLRLYNHGLRLELGAGLVGQAQDTDEDPASGFEVPLQNNSHTQANGRLRYDFFISQNNTAYLSGFALHDSAANLELRLRAELGYRRYIFNEKNHALSAELGGVYTIDRAPFDGDTNKDGVTDMTDENRFEENGGSVGARIMVAYSNALTDTLTLTQTLELVSNLWPELEAPYEQARIDEDADNMIGIGEATTFGSNTALAVALRKNLALALNLTLLYDNAAVSRRNAYTNYDFTTSISLTYKLF